MNMHVHVHVDADADAHVHVHVSKKRHSRSQSTATATTEPNVPAATCTPALIAKDQLERVSRQTAQTRCCTHGSCRASVPNRLSALNSLSCMPHAAACNFWKSRTRLRLK